MRHSAVSPKSQILKDGQIIYGCSSELPCKPPNGLGKSTSIEFVYNKYTVFAESGKQPVFISST